MRRLEPIAATVPYMTAEGNHGELDSHIKYDSTLLCSCPLCTTESGYNFSHYVNRFSMPSNSTSPHWYSWDMGPAHFIRSAQHGEYI